ncbi:MAG: glycosyltransferase [Selenomonadaceae bacterium]|nr:glycosyltransferase [Selenomonadaceae bacterium]
MDDKKIVWIIYRADDAAYREAVRAIGDLDVPEGYRMDVLDAPAEAGKGRAAVYEAKRRQSDAKYKIYLDEHCVVLEKRILHHILEIFQSSEDIGAVGISGAELIPTSGVTLSAGRRLGRVKAVAAELRGGRVEGLCQDAMAVDEFFLATQHETGWREDLLTGNGFAVSSYCVELRRRGYRSVVAKQESFVSAYITGTFEYSRHDLDAFLDEYSKEIYPLVTVIIPTYNRPHFFRGALESVLGQTYRNLDILVSDDGDNDETETLIQPYLAKDPRIQYFHHHGFTVEDNMAFCRRYNHPDAEYVNWLMDDDVFYPEKIAIMVDGYRDNPGVSLVSSVRDIDNLMNHTKGRSGSPFPFPHKGFVRVNGTEAGRALFLCDNYIGEPTTVLLRTEYQRENALYGWSGNELENNTFYMRDVATWLQCLTKGDLLFYSEPLSCLRQHSEQCTFTRADSSRGFLINWAQELWYAIQEEKFLDNEDIRYKAVVIWIRKASETLMLSAMNHQVNQNVKLLSNLLVEMTKGLSNGYQYPVWEKFIEEFNEK